MNSFYVYILKCSDGSFYIGHTDNIENRIAEHQNGRGSKYTALRLPIKLVSLEVFQSRNEAFVIERKIKNWSRVKKQAYIDKNFLMLRKLVFGIHL